jgi:predicted transcriptional regulator
MAGWPPQQLKTIAEQVHDGATARCTVRELLRWYTYERRGRFIIWAIRRDLARLKLRTEPDFEAAYIDGELSFEKLVEQASTPNPSPELEEVQAVLVTSELEDPTHRIGRLPSANSRPVSVNPSATVAEAVTLMLLHDYSQLPVMQGERTLKGAVTWQWLGMKLALGRNCVAVQDCMENAIVMDSDVSLFSAIPAIVERGFVLVRDGQHAIAGIVTTTDLSLQFRQLAEPFLLLGEIEKHLRRLSDGKFSLEDVAAARDPNDVHRKIGDLSDLTFGEHIRLLENPARWSALRVKIDRGTFVKHLNEVRDIRNDVMHFDPDGTAPAELDRLRQFVRLLAAIAA